MESEHQVSGSRGNLRSQRNITTLAKIVRHTSVHAPSTHEGTRREWHEWGPHWHMHARAEHTRTHTHMRTQAHKEPRTRNLLSITQARTRPDVDALAGSLSCAFVDLFSPVVLSCCLLPSYAMLVSLALNTCGSISIYIPFSPRCRSRSLFVSLSLAVSLSFSPSR